MIDHRNGNRTGHILTVEDPIEYLFRHKKSVINQREIGMDTRGWHEALRNAMRQAPIASSSAKSATERPCRQPLAYAQTGHLCLRRCTPTMPTTRWNRSLISSLENRPLLYLDLAVALKSIISQRLVRRPDGNRVPTVEILMNTRHVGGTGRAW